MILILRRSSVVILICIFALSYGLIAVATAREKQADKRHEICVMLDAGHGAPDGGCVGADGTQEAPLNLAVTKKLKQALERQGVRVLMTRSDENGIHTGEGSVGEKKRSDMRMRKQMRDASDAQLFVSIHMNLFAQAKYSGAQVIYDTKNPEAQQVALLLQQALRAGVDAENQRLPMAAKSTIYLLKAPKVPSVIVECGFLSNPTEREKLKTESYQQTVADALCDGIVAYFENKKEGREIHGDTAELKR